LVRDANVLIDALISLIIWGERVNGQAHRRQQPEKLVNTISQKPVRGISPNLGQRCKWADRCSD